MFKKILLLAIFIPLLFTPQVKADRVVEQPSQEMKVEARSLDKRAQILNDYLASYNSPLQDYSQDFIDAADQYGVDWKLVPSIAGVESTFGQNTPGGYNSWGWGVYGDQALYFKSQRQAIFEVTKGLRENYIDRGLTDPYQINYVYAESPYWGEKVSYFMGDLDRFSQNYHQSKSVADKSLIKTEAKVDSASATLNIATKPLFVKLALGN